MFETLIHKYGALVLDGPMATELERMGENLDDPLWSARLLLDAPERIRDVHLRWFRTGADIAITASYQASIDGFCSKGLNEQQAREMIALSAKLAVEARDLFLAESNVLSKRPKPLIAGSIGSYGAALADGSEYRGDFTLSEKELIRWHLPRMEVLAPLVDCFAFETVPCFLEARALVHALKKFAPMPAWLSFSAKDGKHLNSGEPIREVAAWLAEQDHIEAIGINCSHPSHILSLLEEMGRCWTRPMVAYPNSGEVYIAGMGWQGEGQSFDNDAVLNAWYQVGMRMVGGCCRTGTGQIQKISTWRSCL